MTGIDLFTVAPEADEDFLRAWEEDGDADATLYRALRDDVAFRFASVGGPGSYEVVHTDGTPDGAEGVTVISAFDEDFLAAWRREHDLFAAQRGYLGTRLLRSAGTDDLRYVDVMRWSSPLMFSRATARPVSVPRHRALYLVVTRPGRR